MKAGIKIILMVGLVVYGALFAEIFLRLFSPQPIMPRHVIASDYGVRMNEPGTTYWQKTAETRASIHINPLGLRGPDEQKREKTPNVARIALFGDSYFLGYESAFEESFAAQLEAILQARQCRVEVYNFAVSGFGTAEMLRTYEYYGRQFQPDMVLFQWHHTDPADNVRANLYALKAEELVETGADYLPASGLRTALSRLRAYQFIAEHSQVFAALREKIATGIKNIMTGGALVKRPSRVATMATAHAAMAPDAKAINQDRDDRPPASDLDIALLQRATKAVQQDGAQFYLVDIPSWHSRTEFSSSFRLLPATLRQQENFISPIDHFRAHADKDRKIYWEKGHLHLTPYGNFLLAKAVADRLTDTQDERSTLKCPAPPTLEAASIKR